MKYSSKNTDDTGIKYLNNVGIMRNLSASVNFISSSCSLSVNNLKDITEWVFGIVFGFRSNNQNVAPSITGTINIMYIVSTGEMPYEIKAAYEKLPKIPAPPVPDDHDDITLLN